MNEANKLIEQLENLNTQIAIIESQAQKLELENIQIDSALAELEKTEGKVFKAVGPVLVETDAKKMIEELSEKRKDNDKKIEMIKKQAEKLKAKREEVQKQLKEKVG